MDSLQDILNRVLENAAEKTAQRVQPIKNRRPLRDPQTDTVGFFNDISAAVKNIRSPEAARALQSQTIPQDAVNDAGSQPGDSTNELPSSSPAVNTRRTTLKDDANVIGEMTKAAAQIVQQVATAGKAIGDFSGHTGKLGKAVTGMAQTVVSADKDVKASKPAEGFTGWLRSFVGTEKNEQDSAKQQATPQTAGEIISGLNTAKSVANRAATVVNASPVVNAAGNAVSGSQQATESTSVFRSFSESVKGLVSGLTEQRRDSMAVRQNPATARQQMAGAYQWGSYPKKDGFGWAPSSPADNAAETERPESKLDQWLNSSSLADGFRGLMAKIIPQRAQFTGGGPAVNMSGGTAASPGGAQDVNSVADVMAARAMNFFKRISRRPESERANEDQQEDNQNQQAQRTPSFFQNAAQSLRRTIGRQGRRILTKNFRQRVQRGQGMIRGRVRVMPAGGGGAGGAPPAANTALSWPKGTASWANGPGVGSGAGGGGGSGAAGGGAAGANAGRAAGGAGAAGGGGSGGGFFGRMAGMFGGGGGAAGGAGGGAAGGGGGAAGGAGLAAGAVALGFVALAAVVVVAVGALAKLGMQGYETALRVAQFDGQLSAAKAQLDVSRLMRDIGTARTLSEAGAGFMKSLDKLEAALRPITDGAMQVGMEFMIVVIDYVTFALQSLLKATNAVIKGFNQVETALGLDLISDKMLKRLDDMANGRQQGDPQNIPAAGFHNMFQNLPPAAPPRPPLAPLGGP